MAVGKNALVYPHNLWLICNLGRFSSNCDLLMLMTKNVEEKICSGQLEMEELALQWFLQFHAMIPFSNAIDIIYQQPSIDHEIDERPFHEAPLRCGERELPGTWIAQFFWTDFPVKFCLSREPQTLVLLKSKLDYVQESFLKETRVCYS